MNALDRRAFLERATLSFLALPRLTRVTFTRRAPLLLRLAFVDSAPSNKQRHAGISVGVAEAKRGGALFGGSVAVSTVSITQLHALPAVHALLGGGSRDDCLAMARAAAAHRALFVNIGCSDDALRGADCTSTMFHVAPSDAMCRDALGLTDSPPDARVVAWDASLEKFGADTLNGRFQSETGLLMNDDAWLAWVAVKIMWEAALRARTTDGPTLAAHLTRETTQFDGHKGRPLSFRAWDHQLRQPLYVKAPAPSRPIEVPPVRDDESSRDALDRLGTPAARSACHLT